MLVGGINDNKAISDLFWERVDAKSQRIVIRPSSTIPESETSRAVKYFFNVEGKWYQTTDGQCDLCKTTHTSHRKALIGVDNTSTLPSAIFNNMSKPGQVFLDSDLRSEKFKNNEKRVALFRGSVRYTHIIRNNNHFLYDIDYKKYTENEKVRQALFSWINDELISHIDNSAFNIVVSPLHEENSFFLKSVIERGFKGNCRLITLNFHNSYRDEIRTRLGFITKELKSLKSLGMTQTVHTYFIDDCIIEGSTLQRSKQFLYMLLNEAGIDPSHLLLYERIIVLANRSSYDTIYNFLPGRVGNDFYYFVRLNVPSFNTKNGKCPACSLSERYRLANKQASTSLLAREYKRLYQKHVGKSELEYEKWLLEETQQNKNNSNLLLEWIYYAMFKSEDGYYFVDVNGNTVKFAELNKKTLPEYNYLQFLFDDLNLCEILKGNIIPDAKEFNTKEIFKQYFYTPDSLKDPETVRNHQKKLHRIIRDHIVSERAYKRMICTHDIFMRIEKVFSQQRNSTMTTQQCEQELRAAILDIIDRRLTNIRNKAKINHLNTRSLYWLETEWVISYIKVISRKQPGYYYHLKNAIFNILSDILNYVLFGIQEHTDIKKIAQMCSVSESDRCTSKAMPDMTYRLFITVIRRLTAMHSSYLLENKEAFFDWFIKINDQANGCNNYANFFKNENSRRFYSLMILPPSLPEFEFNITKLIKWSTISGIDDSKSCMAERLLTNKVELGELKDSDRVAYIENTSIIYTGIRKLSLECPDGMYSSDDIIYDVVKVVEKSIDPKQIEKNNANPYYELNPYKTFLQFIDYNSYVEEGHKQRIIRILANQVLLFKRLCALEAMKKRIDNPYDYVYICNYIRNIMQYSECVIVSGREQVSIVASSDIYIDYFENDMDEEILYEIVNKYSHDYNKGNTAQ